MFRQRSGKADLEGERRFQEREQADDEALHTKKIN
jgi:hypothetical protein